MIEDLNSIKNLLENIRSDDNKERLKTIAKIPSLIMQSIENKDEILNQLLLVIYNLNTEEDNFEVLNLGNRNIVIRHLLRLYNETIQKPDEEQTNSLVRLIEATNSPELLIELANVFGQSDNEHALERIKEKASENLYADALLMIYSIIDLRQQAKVNKV